MRVEHVVIVLLAQGAGCGLDSDQGCEVGDLQTRACDDPCEQRSRACGADGLWADWGGCEQTGQCGDSCTPGNVETAPCDDPCEESQRTCDAEGQWGGWSGCVPTIECRICAGGDVDNEACGDCSARRRECTEENLWGEWSDCAQATIPEICDGFDNDCDGQTDEDGVCDACAFAQTGESEGLGDGELWAIVANSEGFGFFAGPYYFDATYENFEHRLYRFDHHGRQLGEPVVLDLPSGLPLTTSYLANSVTDPLWTGEEYVFFAAAEDPTDRYYHNGDIWLIRMSIEGDVLEASVAFSLPLQPGQTLRIEYLSSAKNPQTEKIGIFLQGAVVTEGASGHHSLFQARAADLDGTGISAPKDLSHLGSCYRLITTEPYGQGFLTLCRNDAYELIMVPTRIDGSAADRLLPIPSEAREADHGQRVFFRELPGGSLSVLLADSRSDLRSGTLYTIAPEGAVLDEVDIPAMGPGRARIISAILGSGGAVVTANQGQRLLMGRFDGSGALIEELVLLKEVAAEQDFFIGDVSAMAVSGSTHAVVYTHKTGGDYEPHVNMMARIDCEQTCEQNPLCTPGEEGSRPCGLEEGQCELGTSVRSCLDECIWSLWQPCAGAVWPQEEDNTTCTDEIDNNCDGFTDMDDRHCNHCDVEPDHWICGYCDGWSSPMVCDCLWGNDMGSLPCDCVLSGNDECNCSSDPGMWYCSDS